MNATPPNDDELVSTLRSAADVGIPNMRRDVTGVLSAGRKARRQMLTARSAVAITGVALVAFGGSALASAGPQSITAAPATEAPPTEGSGSALPALPDGPADDVFDGTWQQYASALGSCLKSQGWDVQPGLPEEGLMFEIRNAGPGTEKDLQVSQEACRESIGVKAEPERTDDEVRVLYADVVAHYRCFQDAGFTDQEPPSFGTYLAMYRAENILADPMVGVPPNDYFDALKACPRAAPAD